MNIIETMLDHYSASLWPQLLQFHQAPAEDLKAPSAASAEAGRSNGADSCWARPGEAASGSDGWLFAGLSIAMVVLTNQWQYKLSK